MPKLIHHIYSSTATCDFQPDALITLLNGARINNTAMGLSGMLLYAEGTFFQVLEGAPEAVDTLVEKISRDPRHCRLTTIIRGQISKRAFADWSMGFAEISESELTAIIGANDFFSSRRCLTAITDGYAKKLMAAFADGLWQQTLAGRNLPAGGRVAAL